jgi:two-component system, OmpR family, response regulator
MRILLIDDDQKLTRVLVKGLEEERFVVDVAHTGGSGEEKASVNRYEIIVLDWLLPDREGLAVCRDLRARRIPTPILMLTARDALEDRVTGLNAGADDYLTKPFGFSELLARIHALLRRSSLTRPMVLKVADLVLDPRTHRVTRAGQEISLTPKEYAILSVLMRHAGESVTRTRLIESVWETDSDSLFNTLETHVSNLRRKIDVLGTEPLIRTVRGHGYLLDHRPGSGCP